MQIGICSSSGSLPADLGFLPVLLESKEAQRQGINALRFRTVEELEGFRGDCLHLMIAGRLPAAVSARLKAIRIPFVCSVSTILPESLLRNRFVAGFSRRTEIQEYGEVLRAASRILVHSPAGAWMLERMFGFPKTAFTLIAPPLDERVRQSDPDNFREKYDIGSFILFYAGDYSPFSNVLCLLQALERINISSVLIGTPSNSEYSVECRRIARRNPRLRILDESDQNPGMHSSALSACDLFVDVTRYGMWNSDVGNVISLGKRGVVSSASGLRPWFGDSVEYVEPSSPELIHHGIITALNKGPLSQALPASPHARSSSQFLEEMVSCYAPAMKPGGG